jgi:hypothetical protein
VRRRGQLYDSGPTRVQLVRRLETLEDHHQHEDMEPEVSSESHRLIGAQRVLQQRDALMLVRFIIPIASYI